MPAIEVDFFLPLSVDGTVQIGLAPANPISGWTLRVDLLRRFGGTPIVSKYLASGYTQGESGCTLVDGAKGVFQISFNPAEVSGVQTNNLAYQVFRTDSNLSTKTTFGYRLANG